MMNTWFEIIGLVLKVSHMCKFVALASSVSELLVSYLQFKSCNIHDRCHCVCLHFCWEIATRRAAFVFDLNFLGINFKQDVLKMVPVATRRVALLYFDFSIFLGYIFIQDLF